MWNIVGQHPESKLVVNYYNYSDCKNEMYLIMRFLTFTKEKTKTFHIVCALAEW